MAQRDLKMSHEYTVEVLYHFNCGVCKNWWSYAITPAYLITSDLGLPKSMEYYCPNCGADEEATVKKGILDENKLTS